MAQIGFVTAARSAAYRRCDAVFPEIRHAGTAADNTVQDEVISPAKLKENGEQMKRKLRSKTEAHDRRKRFVGKGYCARSFPYSKLLLNQRV